MVRIISEPEQVIRQIIPAPAGLHAILEDRGTYFTCPVHFLGLVQHKDGNRTVEGFDLNMMGDSFEDSEQFMEYCNNKELPPRYQKDNDAKRQRDSNSTKAEPAG